MTPPPSPLEFRPGALGGCNGKGSPEREAPWAAPSPRRTPPGERRAAGRDHAPLQRLRRRRSGVARARRSPQRHHLDLSGAAGRAQEEPRSEAPPHPPPASRGLARLPPAPPPAPPPPVPEDGAPLPQGCGQGSRWGRRWPSEGPPRGSGEGAGSERPPLPRAAAGCLPGLLRRSRPSPSGSPVRRAAASARPPPGCRSARVALPPSFSSPVLYGFNGGGSGGRG